ncbi:hypothetical protein D1007_34614 [Hordeum vulgare]|nr:hypothetical protein D1007_34614 [Hordeum vulgare]
MGGDVIATIISHRVQPLQARPHRICDMSNAKDLFRLSTVELSLHKVAARVNRITNFQLDEEAWRFCMVPFHRGNRAPEVSIRPAGIAFPLFSSLFIRSA